MKTTYQTGLAGEQTASDWLRIKHGMILLETRYRNKAGEIDLIMKDGKTVVFIEVKTRLHAVPGSGLMAVDRKKQQRIARAAVLYLINKGWMNLSVRFDVAEANDSEAYCIHCCSSTCHAADVFVLPGRRYKPAEKR